MKKAPAEAWWFETCRMISTCFAFAGQHGCRDPFFIDFSFHVEWKPHFIQPTECAHFLLEKKSCRG